MIKATIIENKTG